MSLEPSYPASAVVSSEDPSVQFLLGRRVLQKGYAATVLCERCPEGCEVPIEGEAGKRYFICPTGYMERPVPVSEDEVAVYRFNYDTLCNEFAKANGLSARVGQKEFSRGVHPLATGRMLNRKTEAVYLRSIRVEETKILLPLLKGQIGCEKLIVVTPRTDGVDDAILKSLISEDILIASFGDLLSGQSLDLRLGEAAAAPKPRNAYCRIINHEGSAWLDRAEYDALLEKREEYDMFIDGFQKKAWKRDSTGKVTQEKLTAGEFDLLKAYIDSGKVAKPSRFNLTARTFEEARRKVDIKLSRYEWRAFPTHKTPADKRMKQYQFSPPTDLKYCLIVPEAHS